MEPDTDDPTDETTTYAVTLTGAGDVHVRASSPEEAREEAREYATASEHLELLVPPSAKVEQDEPGYRGVANAEDEDDERDGVRIPDVPSVLSLRRVRESLGYSRPEVAEYLDVTATTVGRWEREESAMSLNQARQYAHTLERLSEE